MTEEHIVSFLISLGANITTDIAKKIWKLASIHLSTKGQTTAKLIEDGKIDDTTANQQKELKNELLEIFKRPEVVEVLSEKKSINMKGNENIIIQGSSIKQKNKGSGDNIIGKKG